MSNKLIGRRGVVICSKLLICVSIFILLLQSCFLPIAESRFGDACNNCAGSGKDAIGGRCGACGGSGVMNIQTWPSARSITGTVYE